MLTSVLGRGSGQLHTQRKCSLNQRLGET